MNLHKSFYIPLFLVVIVGAFFLAACGTATSPSTQDPTQVAAAVEATLTAIAATGQDASGSQATATPAPADNDAQAPITLPPRVNGFSPAPRPASSKGDPNAPVVIYEWSDYT